MGTIKTFIFGAAFGAGLVFVALQYHVIQSKDGFRVVARTPQHSLGLAYADVRYWDTEQWADRPELAKALIADGSTELVAGSLTDGVIESVSSDGGTLDQLRSFLNKSPANGSTSDSLFDTPGLSIPDPNRSTPSGDNFFSVPFPGEAKRKTLETAQLENATGKTSATESRQLSIDDVYSATVKKLSDDRFSTDRHTLSESSTSSPSTSMTPARETDLLEDMLFGDDEPVNQDQTSDDNDGGFGIFEDVTNSLQTHADDIMNRARTGIQEEATRSLRDSVNSANRFIRDNATERLPESVSNMFSEDIGGPLMKPDTDSNLPDALKALRNGFDPFVE